MHQAMPWIKVVGLHCKRPFHRARFLPTNKGGQGTNISSAHIRVIKGGNTKNQICLWS